MKKKFKIKNPFKKISDMSLPEKRRAVISIMCIGIFIVISVLLFIFAGKPIIKFISEPETFREWVNSHGIFSRIVFVSMVIFQIIIAIIPGEPFEIAAGYAFGYIEGTILCIIGSLIGSVIVFLFVKKCGRKAVEVFFDKEKINSVSIIKSGKKQNTLAFILFLIPGTPKDILTYCLGLTEMKLTTVIFLSTVAKIPSIITSTIGGNALGMEDYTFAIIVFAVTVVISVIGIYFYNHKNKEYNTEGEEK